MKRIVSILIVVVLGAAVMGAQHLDSSAKVELGEKIERYFGAMAGEDLEVQMEEADFMIGLSSDSLTRQFMAMKIYEHYVASKVMGAENVAVHVFDKWFKDGPLKMDNDIDFMNARVFADFNRQSLIGEKAPELVMEAMDGSRVALFTENDGPGKYRALYFYDSGCSKCMLESILLRNMLLTEDFPIEFYAVYAGDDRAAWEAYVDERFEVDDSSAEIVHLWDPALDSDFQRKYGVLQTPRLFLVNPRGVIIGRGLDAGALTMILDNIFDDVALEYGGGESGALFDGMFAGRTTIDDVREIADYIEESTLGQDNQVLFRQLTGDFLYYLSSKSGEAFKEGAAYLIDNMILSRPDVWRTADDSLKVIGLAKFMDGLLAKAEPGTRIASLKVPAERLRSDRSRTGEFRLDRLCGRRNMIIFYTEGCANCDAEKAVAREFARNDRRIRVLMVNVDRILAGSPDLAGLLFDSFDLSTLPFIIETDRKGIIRRRYLSLLP